MLEEYVGVLLMLGIAVLLALGMLFGQLRWGPRRELSERRELTEEREPPARGEPQIASPGQRHAVKFYLVAILFVIFDVEAIFFYSWGATFTETGIPGLIAIGVFTIPLVVGLIYEWRKGALEW